VETAKPTTVAASAHPIERIINKALMEEFALAARDLQSYYHTFGIIEGWQQIGELQGWLVVPRQMTCKEAHVSSHLTAFITLVREALEQLHSVNCAHHDVRWPNVCFFVDADGHFRAAFLDLDRMKSTYHDYPMMLKSAPDFYSKPNNRPDWTYAHQDVKQLAMLGLEAHEQKQGPGECTCEACKELRTVKEAGKFSDDSLFRRARPEVESEVSKLKEEITSEPGNQFCKGLTQ